MKKIIATILFIATVPAFAGEISKSDIQNILSAEDTLNTFCRGWTGDNPNVDAACDARDKLDKVLKRHDWCYGKKGEAGYQMQWHKCTKDSER